MEDIVFSDTVVKHSLKYEELYNGARGDDAKLMRFQYLSVEEELNSRWAYSYLTLTAPPEHAGDSSSSQRATPHGRIALDQIATLGAEREITPHRSGQEAVKVMFDEVEQVDGKAIRELLKQTLA